MQTSYPAAIQHVHTTHAMECYPGLINGLMDRKAHNRQSAGTVEATTLDPK